jgi:uncharacterized membrane protein YedE/YeeE
MFRVVGSTIVTGIISIQLIKRLNIKATSGGKIIIQKKEFRKGQIYGGLIFGLGWALTGACPGPLFAQIGSGFTVIIITLLPAMADTWIYGRFADKLLLSSDKILSSEIKRLRNEYLEISPYIPTYYTPDGQKWGSFQKGIEIFILS